MTFFATSVDERKQLGYSLNAGYNAQMSSVKATGHLPDTERLSVLAAVIMLVYALNHFMGLPTRRIELQIPGLFVRFELTDSVITAMLAAGIAAAGTDWLLRDHPVRNKQRLFPHLLLPAVTALVIGIPLNQMEFSLVWAIGLLAGTILLVLVLVAEYIVLDTQDVRQPLAAASLTAVGFATYLVLATAMSAAETRLFFLLPAVGIATWLVSVRSLSLRLHGEWVVYEAAIVSLVVVQMAAAIHYWPLTPLRFGLILLGPAYALTSLILGLIEEKPVRKLVIEPVIVLALAWASAVVFA